MLTLTCQLFPLYDVRADDPAAKEKKEAEEDAGKEAEMTQEIVEINTPEDFLNFAEHCSFDFWSANKRVVLNQDIDLSHTEFKTVPVFMGVFDGGGHTIFGYTYGGDGYVMGLFRYIKESGLVENLKVEGEITASEEKEYIGGLCGINDGTIRKCVFRGTVSGKTAVGGIAGMNEDTGVIQNCSAEGQVLGYYSTGGIVGENHGMVDGCINRTSVNNNSEWVEEADEMEEGFFPHIQITESEVKFFSGIDTGGIAGSSDGIITGCTNYGRIGYEHAGYNIGGIAGRQSGVVSLCTNEGTIYGRKDVGGVVGQMEPYIGANEEASLRDEVGKLHDLIEKTIDDMGDGKNVLKRDLDALTVYSDGAVDTGDALVRQIADFTDGNLDQAQTMADRLDYVMDELPDVFEDIAAAREDFSKADHAFGQIGNSGNAGEKLTEAQKRVDEIIEKIGSNSGSVDLSKLDELGKALEELSDSMKDVADSIPGNMGNDMAEARDYLQKASNHIKSATKEMKNIMDYINGQENIRFSKLGETFDVNRENLHTQLRGMSDCVKRLSNDGSSYSDVVNEDLKAVNDQINIVFNLLADDLEDYDDANIEDFFGDMEIEDAESVTTGKADRCVNKGIVNGDTNVGGIAGAMSIDKENPGDSTAGRTKYRIGRKYDTQCVITGSVNRGDITSKKDNVGGIAGYMRRGTIMDSESYGSVESTEGDYAGGICGESLAVIKRCYVLGSISGGKNVGGIAGFADTLKNCFVIADCQGTSGKIGAIAGQTVRYEDEAEQEVKVSGNYFVSGKLYGIDNISYVGAAEAVSYEEMLKSENLPGEFSHLKVTFRVEDSYLGTQELSYGESLSKLEYPSMPEKEGYYGVWPDYSGEVMEGNLLITGEYKEDVTVVQSEITQTPKTEEEGRQREKPYALVEQRFTEETVLKADISDVAPPQQIGDREYVIYDIALENAGISDTDTVAIRLYNPYEEAAVWGFENGTWTELESKVRGGYLQVDMKGMKKLFCVAKKPTGKWKVAGGAAGGVAALALLVLSVKKLRAKRRAKKEENMFLVGEEAMDDEKPVKDAQLTKDEPEVKDGEQTNE